MNARGFPFVVALTSEIGMSFGQCRLIADDKLPAVPNTEALLSYRLKLESVGATKFARSPEKCGTEGESRAVLGMTIKIPDDSKKRVGIRYKAHFQYEG